MTQVKRVEMVVKFWNHVKTLEAPADVLMNVRRPIDQVTKTHQYGTPFLEHLSRTRGACPFCASAYKYREPVYKKALPDEVAEVKMTALMMDGRAAMLALLIAMTHGEAAAPGSPFLMALRSRSSL